MIRISIIIRTSYMSWAWYVNIARYFSISSIVIWIAIGSRWLRRFWVTIKLDIRRQAASVVSIFMITRESFHGMVFQYSRDETLLEWNKRVERTSALTFFYDATQDDQKDAQLPHLKKK